MELKRILAKDSRTAMDIATKRYGKEVLVVSSQSVGGQVELVVALEVAPVAKQPAAEEASSAFTQAFRQALGPMPSAPSVSAAPRASNSSGPLLNAPVMSAAQAFGRANKSAATGSPLPASASPQSQALAAARSAAQALRPAAAGAARSAQPAASAAAAASESQAAAASFAPGVAAPRLASAPQDDGAGRQVVDLVRREIAALRKEFALSRQVQAWQDGRHWPPALAPVMQALQEQGVPAGLRALMVDAAAESAEAAGPQEALDAMRGLLSAALSAPAAVRLERGVHAIVGPSGAGKSQMITRLARAAAMRAGSQQVAIIAFNDQRFGAWSHSRVLASQAGVACLRAGDVATLRLLLGELAGHALVFVDTAGVDCLAQARLLRELKLGIHLHLLLPADASIGAVRSLVEGGAEPAPAWRSLMVGKVDESSSPWALLQTLCEGRPPVSYMSDTGDVQSNPRAFDASRLIVPAFNRLAEEVARIARGRQGATDLASGRVPGLGDNWRAGLGAEGVL